MVKEVDSKSTGLCPREFKSRRCRLFFALTVKKRHRVRVVKELVLKANGLCPREFKSRRCRHSFSVGGLVLFTRLCSSYMSTMTGSIV